MDLSKIRIALNVTSLGICLLCLIFHEAFTANSDLVSFAIFLSYGIALGIIDIRILRLPNRLLLDLFIWLLIAEILCNFGNRVHYVLASAVTTALVVAIVLATVSLLSRGNLGMGDAKYSVCIAVFCSNTNSSLLVALWLAGVFAVIHKHRSLVGKSKELQIATTHIPFGPYLAAGTIVGFAFAQIG